MRESSYHQRRREVKVMEFDEIQQQKIARKQKVNASHQGKNR